MNKELRKQIVKGTVAEYAGSVAHIQNITEAELAIILKEISEALLK